MTIEIAVEESNESVHNNLKIILDYGTDII
jgi:hypothetical protein